MQRPTSVTVFGILNIVFAGLGVVGLLMSLVFFTLNRANPNDPMMRIIENNPAYANYIRVMIPVGGIAAAALLAAGIGLLMMKPWGRTLSIVYAIFALVNCTVGLVMNFVFLIRPLIEQANQARGPEAAGMMGGAIGAGVGGCFGYIYPILLLIFMFRRNVIAAFRPAQFEAFD
ncbi:MAG: hypothetical protein ACJ8C4_22020 [Gemmataceae bacterium]